MQSSANLKEAMHYKYSISGFTCEQTVRLFDWTNKWKNNDLIGIEFGVLIQGPM